MQALRVGGTSSGSCLRHGTAYQQHTSLCTPLAATQQQPQQQCAPCTTSRAQQQLGTAWCCRPGVAATQRPGCSSVVQQHQQRHGSSSSSSWQCRAAKKGSSSSSSQGNSSPPGARPPADDSLDDVIMIGDDADEDDEGDEASWDDDGGEYEWDDGDDDEDEEGEEEEFGVLDDDDDDDDGGGFLAAGSDDDPGPEILTGNVGWGDTALRVARAALARPENTQLSLYLFRVLAPSRTIEIRLDRLDDRYGSPQLDDIERFSRALAQGLEEELGPDVAGGISFEVSSPGAERQLLLPQELSRFKELPMRVEFMSEVGVLTSLVLTFLQLDAAEGTTHWALADVKANASVKGRGLSKKQRLQRYDIPLERLERVRIYVDF